MFVLRAAEFKWPESGLAAFSLIRVGGGAPAAGRPAP
jgi:hypothetical protein